jgi:hypothetical protein
MAFWHKWLPGRAGKKSVSAAKPPAKSAERRRMEQSILDTRREILARIDQAREQREAIDPHEARAAFVIEQMLQDLEGKGKSKGKT